MVPGIIIMNHTRSSVSMPVLYGHGCLMESWPMDDREVYDLKVLHYSPIRCEIGFNDSRKRLTSKAVRNKVGRMSTIIVNHSRGIPLVSLQFSYLS